MSKDFSPELLKMMDKIKEEREANANKKGCMSLFTILIIVILFTIQFAF